MESACAESSSAFPPASCPTPVASSFASPLSTETASLRTLGVGSGHYRASLVPERPASTGQRALAGSSKKHDGKAPDPPRPRARSITFEATPRR